MQAPCPNADTATLPGVDDYLIANMPLLPFPTTNMPLPFRQARSCALSSDIMVAYSKTPHHGSAYGDLVSLMLILIDLIGVCCPTDIV